MRVYEDDKANRWVIEQMRERLERDVRVGAWHASEIYACPRKAILGREKKVSLTDRDILYFIRGYAVQQFIFGDEEEGKEFLGVILSPDHVAENHVFEMKSTNLWYESRSRGRFDPQIMSDWIVRTKAYCAAVGTNIAHIVVYFTHGPELHTWTLEFSDAELEKAKLDIEARRTYLDTARKIREDTGALPSVTERAYEKECDFCKFKDLCLRELQARRMA